MSVGIASLASSVLMSVMYVLFLRHPSEKDELETSKDPADKAVVKANESMDMSGSTEEVVAHESASTTMKMNENGTVKMRRTIRKEDAATNPNQNSAKVRIIDPTPSPPKEVWYMKITNDVRNTKFSFSITLKCVLLFVANTLSYFVAKGIQDWIGKFQRCCCVALLYISNFTGQFCCESRHFSSKCSATNAIPCFLTLNLFTNAALYLVEYLHYQEGPRLQIWELVIWNEVRLLLYLL